MTDETEKLLGGKDPDEDFISKHGSWKLRKAMSSCADPDIVVALVKLSGEWHLFSVYGTKIEISSADVCRGLATTTPENPFAGIKETKSNCTDNR